MSHVRNDHLSDHILWLALECDDFKAPMYALDAELEVSAQGRFSARKRFAKACGFHCAALGGRTSFPASAGLDLFIGRSNDECTFRHWLALAVENSCTQFGGRLFYQQGELCKVYQLIMDEVDALPSVLVDSLNMSKGT